MPSKNEKGTLRLPEPMAVDGERSWSLRDVYHVVFRHKSKVAAFFIAVALAAGYAILSSPATYLSEAQLLIRQGRESTMDPAAAASGPSVRLYMDWENQLNSELAILTSEELAETVAARVGPERILRGPTSTAEQTLPLLGSLRRWFESAREGLRTTPETTVSSTGPSPIVQAAGGVVANGLDIAVAEKSNIIELSFASTDAALSQQILAQLLASYQDRHIEVYRSSGSHGFFKEQRDKLQAQLETTEQNIRSLNNELGIASLDSRRSLVAARIGSFEAAIADAELDMATAEARVNEIRKQLGNENQEKEGYVPQRSMFNQETRDRLQATRMDEERQLVALTAKAVSLREQLESARNELKTLNDNETKLTQLIRKKQMIDDQFRTYSDYTEQARINEALESEKISNIAVVQPATLPSRPLASNRLLKLILAMATGLLGGIVIAFVFDHFNTALSRPEDVEVRLTLPTLVAIPLLEDGSFASQVESSGKIEQTFASSATRHFDVLRDRLGLAMNGATPQHPVVIGVTSSHPGEGVSTIASNLAVNLARNTDEHVLFVDANLKNPTASELFGVTRGPGVAEILVDGEGNTSMIENNLYVLPAGQPSESARQALVPQRFEALLTRVRDNQYGYVVLDIPPMSDGAASARLSGMSDGVILVTEAERVRWEVAQRSKDLLEEAHANILGVVLNKRRFYVPDWLYEKL